ncbi:MAG: DEAD/DEAH box helicase, partial [Patescibacteria group bacterium]
MEKKPRKHIIDIAPLTRIPLNRSQSFSYLYDKKLPEGTLVSVPLFRRSLPGIVLKSRNDFRRLGNIQLKKIESVLEENFLDKKQLELADFLSDYFISPLGIILKAFVPKRVKSRKAESLAKKKIPKKKIILTKDQKSAVEKITGKNSKNYKLQPEAGPPWAEKTNSFLLYGPNASGKTEVYLETISKLKAKNPNLQFLILLPELVLASQALERYSAHFNPAEIAVLGSNIAQGKFYSDWQKIKSGEAKLIIGTRMAVFAPFRKLGLIVVDESQDASFKQWDMNPRYDARKASEGLSRIHKCPLVFGSATPRIEDYFKAQQGEYQLLKLPELKLKPGSYNPETIIVDMKKERWAKRFSPISEKLSSEIYFTLKHKGQIALFINRQ